jgi:uncharacterized SAM-binding protein YcdF (DUF218 family)
VEHDVRRMIYLHKILPLFVLPVGVALLLLLAGLRWRRRSLIWAGVAVLWLSSTPLIGRLAIRAVEGRAVHGLAANAPSADVIVVLSEGRVTAPGPAAASEWHDADRFFGGIELFKARKAPLLVFTGGASPGKSNSALEGDILAGYARTMGVPETQILTTPRVLNTAEEARAVAEILRAKLADTTRGGRPARVLLVTSAFHMSRARRLFERAGMSIIPYPLDFKTSAGRTVSPLALLPTAEALQQTEMSLRELYGRLFYLVVR